MSQCFVFKTLCDRDDGLGIWSIRDIISDFIYQLIYVMNKCTCMATGW